jgi:glycerol-3-phosphate dehydrogenase
MSASDRAILRAEVIVIGGGATGCGVARDLAQRGVGVLLLEQHDLAYGATGRCHGLLHSGVRYAVNDPVAARECIEENKIVLRIAPHCTEPTGGLSVALPEDDPAYYDQLRRGCDAAGIECAPLSPADTLALEPHLNPRVVRALRVPDASVDPFLLSQENARAAARDGAQVLTHCKVASFVLDGRRVVGVRFADESGQREARAPLTVLAAGGWTKQLAALAGVEVNLSLSKGSLIIANRRYCDRVINRCRKPGDGDLLIPNGPTSIIGTTSITVPSADGLRIEEGELSLMLDQGERMVPGFGRTRALRAYAGVRPLFKESGDGDGDGRAISRGFFVLDHAARDNTPGLVSIVGGKLTTYRLMAEKTADKVCEILGVKRECRTAQTPLWSSGFQPEHYRRHERLARLGASAPGAVVCECELVERGAIERILGELHGRADIADIQHRTRLGMGTCQGGMCATRALAILQEHALLPPGTAAPVLRRFLEQRFAGIAPVLWGDQLREEALNYALYATLFGLDRESGA